MFSTVLVWKTCDYLKTVYHCSRNWTQQHCAIWQRINTSSLEVSSGQVREVALLVQCGDFVLFCWRVALSWSINISVSQAYHIVFCALLRVASYCRCQSTCNGRASPQRLMFIKSAMFPRRPRLKEKENACHATHVFFFIFKFNPYLAPMLMSLLKNIILKKRQNTFVW